MNNVFPHLPHGSESDLITHYFQKGLTNKDIVLMLEKHHGIEMITSTVNVANALVTKTLSMLKQ